jgi:hypothetical protein
MEGTTAFLFLRGDCHPRNLTPSVKSLAHLLMIVLGWQHVAAQAEKRRDWSMRCKELLRMACRLEPAHCPFPLAARLVGILRAIIERAMLPMFESRQELPLRRPIARQLSGGDDSWDVLNPLSSLRQDGFAAALSPRRCTRLLSTRPS